MMPSPKPIQEVQDAKTRLAARYAGQSWFRGIGIAPSEQPNLFKLRLTLDPSAKENAEVPQEYEGIPVEVVFLAAYRPREADKRRPTSR